MLRLKIRSRFHYVVVIHQMRGKPALLVVRWLEMMFPEHAKGSCPYRVLERIRRLADYESQSWLEFDLFTC